MKRIIKFFGSLSFALWLIGGFAAVLIASTLLESARGTPFAQRFFYSAGWFDVFLGFFGLNILCSALSRWPFKKFHTGFLLVHASILIILAGAFLSRYTGVDGQIALLEGTTENQIALSGFELTTERIGQSVTVLGLNKNSSDHAETIAVPEPGANVILKKTITNARVTKATEEGSVESEKNLGIEFVIKSKLAGANQSISLFQNNSSSPAPNVIEMGAATFELLDTPPMEVKETVTTGDKTRLHITENDSKESFAWDLEPLPTQNLSLGTSGITVKNIRYFPDARVGPENKLISVSDEPLNPAIEFEAVDKTGHSETQTYFELFPNFKSLHKNSAKNDSIHLTISLEVPKTKNSAPKRKSGIQFFQKNGRWAYHSHSSKSADREDYLELHKEYPAGWMDFTFSVEKFFSHAQFLNKVSESSAEAQGAKVGIAALISLEKDGHEISAHWILPGETLRIDSSKGPVIVGIRQRSVPAPFSLTLKQFRKVDYPGTTDASSFESDVSLEDKAEGIKIEKTISMNKPLDYKGYRIFQSSFSQDPESGTTSVFTVAKNPGIKLIYWGSVLLCLGIIIVFYIKPLSSFGRRDNTYASKK